MSVTRESKIVIVGAGCFGLSTAYHLLKRGFIDITIIDRSAELPAPEAASTDINKVVRSSYSDVFYTRLAREAIAAWKDKSEWGDTYHESGVFVRLSGNGSYSDKAYLNDLALGAQTERLDNAAAIRAIFPPGVKTASLDDSTGYLNRDGGWAYAAQGVSVLMSKVIALGGRIVPGKTVMSFVKSDGKTVGVKCADGTVFPSDLVVLSAGSWTASSFPELGLQGKCLATGQVIATVKLSPEETEIYRKCPVYLDFQSDFYAFPAKEDGLMKFGLHAAGYTYMKKDSPSFPAVSTPQFVPSPSNAGSLVPKSSLEKMRAHLADIYPDLAQKPFHTTRLCWYTDSPDDDWVIGFHPADPVVMLATSGSGHAYKFLPVIGRLVADAIQGTMTDELVKKFAFDREMPPGVSSPSRPGQVPQELDFSQLCKPDDLLPLNTISGVNAS